MREVRGHSSLRPYPLHGGGRDEELRASAASGGVGVTTFETVRALELPPRVKVAMIVVDEAHYVKNPDTQRSQALRGWTNRVPSGFAVVLGVDVPGCPVERRRLEQARHALLERLRGE